MLSPVDARKRWLAPFPIGAITRHSVPPGVGVGKGALLLLAALGCSNAAQEESGGRGSENLEAADAGPCHVTIREVENEGAEHLSEGAELSFASNPPASGDHYGAWTRFEPFEDRVVPRGYWVHNLEHGGVALLFGPDAPERVVRELLDLYDDLPDDESCGHARALLTEDPELDDPVAVVAWDVVLEATCVDRTLMLDFVRTYRGRAPEDICTHGSYLP